MNENCIQNIINDIVLRNLSKVKKAVRRQHRFNAAIVIFAMSITAYVTLNEIRIIENDKKIEELKRAKGE